MLNDESIEYVYDKTEKRMIGNKLCTVRVRANKPSPEAMKSFANTFVQIMREVERREKEGKKVVNGQVVEK